MASESIEPAFQAAIAAGKINGAVLCAADTSGAFSYQRALGERTLLSGENRPQQLDDMLYLASATKLITTVAALQCVEDGLLSLDDPVAPKFAPELDKLQVLPERPAKTESDDDPDPAAPAPELELEPPARPITLAMLLSHTSGLSYDFLVPRLAAWRARHQPPLAEGARRPVEEAFDYPLSFHPGTGWMYGSGLDWAGRVVERATGERLGDRVRARICAPLGIPPDDAQFYPVRGDAVRARLVDLNPADPEGLGRAVLGGSGEINKRSVGDFGGHGLFMTAEGYLAVLQSLLRNDGRLLRPETVEAMFRNYIIGPEAEEGFRAALEGPHGVFFRVGIEPGVKVGHGLGGVLTLEDQEGWYGEGTMSWGGGLTFAWFIDRKNGLCGLGAVQAALPVDVEVVSELKQTFRHDIYRKYAAWKKEAEGERTS